MGKRHDGIDWKKPYWKDMLVYQRKFMWHQDTLERLASWLGLRQGMTVIDVGCGLGYLGYTYWKYFGLGSHYYGIDGESELLHDSKQAADEWSSGGTACFAAGNAYELPFSDNTADWVMCQTLLIHLKDPETALAEMIRVAKPGGLIMCKEPDHLAGMMTIGYWSMPEFSIEDELFFRKKSLICHKGRVKLGRGDNHIAPKIPHLMKQLGLTQVDIRNNDRVTYLEPPYEDEWQQQHLESQKKFFLSDGFNEWMDKEREEFLAGGGTQDEWDIYFKKAEEANDIRRKQIENGEFFVCAGTHFYVIKGTKPR